MPKKGKNMQNNRIRKVSQVLDEGFHGFETKFATVINFLLILMIHVKFFSLIFTDVVYPNR